MLQSIDTLIAFVVIMTVASLFVTILVQMCSAALSLRGKNLANALALTFQTLAPSLQGEAHRLSAKILSDPLLSDSTRTLKNKLTGLAATIVTRVTPWHFFNIGCAARLATAVRAEEVYRGLLRLADEQKDPNARRLLDALFLPAEETKTIQSRLGVFREIAQEIADLPTREKLLAAIEETPADLLVRADAAQMKLERLFDAAQDRAQQWFQVHTRGLTIAASFLIAFVFQLDAVEIFHRVSVSPAARNALVAATQTVAQQAGAALGENAAAASLREKQIVLDRLDREIESSGFDFIPVGFWRWPTETPEPPATLSNWTYFWTYWRHSAGMLLFTALLTLGAPYWYNILKNLTSLRPALAQAIGREEKRNGVG